MYDAATVRAPDLRIIAVLASLATHYRRAWCYPSQRYIRAELAARYARDMSRRTLCRHLRALELHGWIRRQRRHRRAASGGLELHSTLYVLLRRAHAWAAHMCITALWRLRPQPNSLNHIAVTDPAQRSTLVLNINTSTQAKKPPGWKTAGESLREFAGKLTPRHPTGSGTPVAD